MGYYMGELYRRYFRAPDFSELKEEIEHTRQEVRDWLDQTQRRQIRYCSRLPSRPCFLKVTSASPCCQPRPMSSLPQYWHF